MPWTHRSFWLLPLGIGLVLGIPVLVVAFSRLAAIYRRYIHAGRQERNFLASFGFFGTVLTVRAITVAIHNDIGPFHNVSMHGRHIHHLVWGILLLLLVGYGWLMEIDQGESFRARWFGRLQAIVYGIAAALTLDEFALWLNLRDVYWEREGRESFEALGLFAGVLGIGLFGRAFFAGIVHELARVLGPRARNEQP